MTLVILSLAPFIWIVSIISSKVYFYWFFSSNNRTFFVVNLQISEKMFAEELRAYERAGAIAEEVFSNVRTVFAFNGTQHEQMRWDMQFYSLFAIHFSIKIWKTYWICSKTRYQERSSYWDNHWFDVFHSIWFSCTRLLVRKSIDSERKLWHFKCDFCKCRNRQVVVKETNILKSKNEPLRVSIFHLGTIVSFIVDLSEGEGFYNRIVLTCTNRCSLMLLWLCFHLDKAHHIVNRSIKQKWQPLLYGTHFVKWEE